VGCAAVGILVALYQSTAMLAEGVPFGTVLAVNAISITAGLITGGISNAAGNSFAAALVVGAISSAGTAALTAYAMGGEISATDLLLAAAQGAAVAGFVWGVAPTKPVTQANVAEAQGGGGTGQAQVESDARSEVVAGASGPHDPIELGKNGNPVLVEGPRTPAQNEQDVLARKWLSSEAPQSGGRTVLEATTGKGIEYGVTKPVDGPMGPTKPGGKDAVSLHNYGAGKNAFGAHTHPPTGGPEFSNADLVAARGMGAPLYLGDPKGNLWVLDPVANTIMFVSGPPAYVPGTSALPDTSRFR